MKDCLCHSPLQHLVYILYSVRRTVLFSLLHTIRRTSRSYQLLTCIHLCVRRRSAEHKRAFSFPAVRCQPYLRDEDRRRTESSDRRRSSSQLGRNSGAKCRLLPETGFECIPNCYSSLTTDEWISSLLTRINSLETQVDRRRSQEVWVELRLSPSRFIA